MSHIYVDFETDHEISRTELDNLMDDIADVINKYKFIKMCYFDCDDIVYLKEE